MLHERGVRFERQAGRRHKKYNPHTKHFDHKIFIDVSHHFRAKRYDPEEARLKRYAPQTANPAPDREEETTTLFTPDPDGIIFNVPQKSTDQPGQGIKIVDIRKFLTSRTTPDEVDEYGLTPQEQRLRRFIPEELGVSEEEIKPTQGGLIDDAPLTIREIRNLIQLLEEQFDIDISGGDADKIIDFPRTQLPPIDE